MIFRVAILQMRSFGRDKWRNTETIVSKMKDAAGNNADILLLPECFITGYDLPIQYKEALSYDDKCLLELCKRQRISISES